MAPADVLPGDPVSPGTPRRVRVTWAALDAQPVLAPDGRAGIVVPRLAGRVLPGGCGTTVHPTWADPGNGRTGPCHREHAGT